MKGIYLLIQNHTLGKKILYFDEKMQWADQAVILKNFQRKVTPLGGATNETNAEEGLKYGMSKAFFRELFLPAASTFQNDIFEVTIEQNRFVCYPYYFPDDSEDHSQATKKQAKKTLMQAAKPKTEKILREKKQLIEQLVQSKQIPAEAQAMLEAQQEEEASIQPHDIKAFSVVFVLDSYRPELAVARLPELRDSLKMFVHTLVQEELRDRFVGREAMKILRAKSEVKKELSDKGQGSLSASRIKDAILTQSVLASNLTDIFESYLSGQTKCLCVNNWIQMQINQHPSGLPLSNIKVGLQTQSGFDDSSDSSSSSSDEDQSQELESESAANAEERKRTSSPETIPPRPQEPAPSNCTEDLYLEGNFFGRVNNMVILPNQTFILQVSKKSIQFPQDSTPLLRHSIHLLNPMQSFQTICIENSLTFDEITRVAKHLLFWGLGKIIYPIRPSSVYCLSKETPEILRNPAIVEQLMQKLPDFFDQRGNAEDREGNPIKCALQMFAKPVSLFHVTQQRKRPMQEVQKITFLLLKYNILQEKVKRLVLKLPSSLDVKQNQISKVRDTLLKQSGSAAQKQIDLVKEKIQQSKTAQIEVEEGRQSPTIEEFIAMVKEMECQDDDQDASQPNTSQDSSLPAEAETDTSVLSNTPAALLERIYPFMLSRDLNIASDLCLFGGCSEEQLQRMLNEYQMIIEVLWY